MEKTDTKAADGAPETAGGGKAKVVIVGFISFVVVFETALFFFLVPSAEEISALAEARLVQTVQEQKEKAEEQAVDQEKVSEFALGEFGETFSPIDSERSYRVEMRIYGLVRNKNQEKLKAEFAQKEGRLRHAIRMKIRNSEVSELSENQLGLLQRRILTTSNHLLEGDLLLGIGFNDYQLVEE
ncbi:MAG TPA: dihydrolipoamide acetyltransferase [Planctomycetaceae bacterium]|nr:dihydrolipoamide acetyltransferase [Planctomycetaceae bacterium]